MDDLDRAFRALDAIVEPDLSGEIDRRIASGPGNQPEGSPPRRRSGRLVAAAVAFTVFGAAAVFAWQVFAPIQSHVPTPPSPSTSDPWAAAYSEGWTELPPPPEIRDGADIVWMGDRLLMWGGSPRGVGGAAPAADGFVFDPLNGSWTATRPAPVAGTGGETVWTGSEVLLWGVDTSDGVAALAFDPQAQTWRRFAGPPQGPRFGVTHVWTGRQLILFGGGPQGSPTGSGGAVYDPSNDTWRVTESAPIPMNLADAVWTGSEMIVIGSDLDGRNVSRTPTAVAEAYDPATDTWRKLPDPPISPQTSALAFVDGRVIAWEAYSPSSAEYLPGEDRWRSLDTGDLRGGECYAQGATIGDVVFTWNCGSPAAWYAQTSSWVDTLPPLPATDARPAYSRAGVTAAGSAVVADQVETVVGKGGSPYLGSPDAPVHLWLWRPPSLPLVSTRVPTADDATNLVSTFVAVWSRDIRPYLPVYATAGVLAKISGTNGGLDVFQAFPFRTWRFPDHPTATDLGGGRFEVRVTLTLTDGRQTTVVFEVGRGTTGDGRDAQLLAIGVRLDGS